MIKSTNSVTKKKKNNKITVVAHNKEECKNTIITNYYLLSQPTYTFIPNPKHLFKLTSKNEYEFPKQMPTHNYKLLEIDRTVNDAEELRDGVEDMIQNNIHWVKKIKMFFRHGNIDKTIQSNMYIENLMNYFYSKMENKINFIFDIYAAPHIRNNLFFNIDKSVISETQNNYKISLDKIKARMENNSFNILNKYTMMRLNKLRKLKMVIQDYKALSEVKESENNDFEDYAYLNNKITKYDKINLTYGQEREIILCHNHLFDYKPKLNNKKRKELEELRKRKNILDILFDHKDDHEGFVLRANEHKVIDFLIKRHMKGYYPNGGYERKKKLVSIY